MILIFAHGEGREGKEDLTLNELQLQRDQVFMVGIGQSSDKPEPVFIY